MEGGAFHVDRVVTLAHEAGPLLPLVLAAFDCNQLNCGRRSCPVDRRKLWGSCRPPVQYLGSSVENPNESLELSNGAG